MTPSEMCSLTLEASMKYFFGFWICLLFLCASGCSMMQPKGQFSASDVLRENTNTIDLLAELRKDKLLQPSAQLNNDEYSQALDEALKEFNASWGEGAKDRRNQVLDRIIMASNLLCESYKSDLMNRQARVNFLMGALGTTVGAAGAVVKSVSAANNFSALSSITSGVRAEYNQEYFASQAAGILSKAIDKQRFEMLGDFIPAREMPVAIYSIELAIADGVTYHGACSLAGAYKYAENAVAKIDTDLGPKTTAASTFGVKEKKDAEKNRENALTSMMLKGGLK